MTELSRSVIKMGNAESADPIAESAIGETVEVLSDSSGLGLEVDPISRTLSNLKKESKMPKPKPPYAQAFRDQMVELVRSGRTQSDLSKEFGCHVTSILSWVRQTGGSGATTLPANVAALNAQERLSI